MATKRQRLLMVEQAEREPMAAPGTGEVRVAKRPFSIGAHRFRIGQYIPDELWANAGNVALHERVYSKWLPAAAANYDPPAAIEQTAPTKPRPTPAQMDALLATARASSWDIVAQGRALRDAVIAALDPREGALWPDIVAAHDRANELYLRALGASAHRGVPHRRIANLDVGKQPAVNGG